MNRSGSHPEVPSLARAASVSGKEGKRTRLAPQNRAVALAHALTAGLCYGTVAQTLPDGSYGALSEEAYRDLLETNPFWVHVTPRRNFGRIAEHGLRPWDEIGFSTAGDDEVKPRPGCVYLGAIKHWEHAWVMAGDLAGNAIVVVDLRGVERERILPDEDDWSGIIGGLHDPAEHGIEPYSRRKWKTGRAWAEGVQLGSQPGVCELALESGVIAVRGTIGPRWLAFEPENDQPYATPFWLQEIEQRHLQTAG